MLKNMNSFKFSHVCDPEINGILDKLSTLVWDILKGESSWNKLTEDSFTFYVHWTCFSQRFEVSSIKGKLRGKEYCMKFGGIGTVFELELDGMQYSFSGNPNYGSFKVPGSVYLEYGHSCFSKKGSCETSNLMNNEAKRKVLSFVIDLIETVYKNKTPFKHNG